jgi:hypothetical protein
MQKIKSFIHNSPGEYNVFVNFGTIYLLYDGRGCYLTLRHNLHTKEYHVLTSIWSSDQHSPGTSRFLSA